MSALTKNERDGLDEVFSSIHSHANKYQKIKEISALIINHQTGVELKNLFKVATYGLKENKLSTFIIKYTKKKKNLSK